MSGLLRHGANSVALLVSERHAGLYMMGSAVQPTVAVSLAMQRLQILMGSQVWGACCSTLHSCNTNCTPPAMLLTAL